MVRWRLKACPRCGSDMYIEKDFDNIYQQCLMCSYRIDLQRVPVNKVPVHAGGSGDGFDDESLEDE